MADIKFSSGMTQNTAPPREAFVMVDLDGEKEPVKVTIGDLLSNGFTYKGIAEPDTNPITIQGFIFYIASIPGIYANFNNLQVNKGEIALLKRENNVWSKDSLNLSLSSSIYNVSYFHPSSTGLYSPSQARAIVPENIRKEGLIISYEADDYTRGIWRVEQYTNADTRGWNENENWELIYVAGKYGNIGQSLNVDEIAHTGFYTTYAFDTEGVPDKAKNWYLMHINSSSESTYAYQRAVAFSTENISYERTKENNTWGPWRTIKDATPELQIFKEVFSTPLSNSKVHFLKGFYNNTTGEFNNSDTFITYEDNELFAYPGSTLRVEIPGVSNLAVRIMAIDTQGAVITTLVGNTMVTPSNAFKIRINYYVGTTEYGGYTILTQPQVSTGVVYNVITNSGLFNSEEYEINEQSILGNLPKQGFVIPKGGTVLLSGASFAIPSNTWFEQGCEEMGVTPINKAVGGQTIVGAANSIHAGTFWTDAEFENHDVFVIMHVHNRDVFTGEFSDLGDYTLPFPAPTTDFEYARGYDYVIKKYISLCYQRRNIVGSKWYGTKEGKPVQMAICTHWHDGRTTYNESVRKLCAKWRIPLIAFDENVGFTKNEPDPTTGIQRSIPYAYPLGGDTPDTEVIDGVTYGWHMTGGTNSYIQKKLARIFVESVSKESNLNMGAIYESTNTPPSETSSMFRRPLKLSNKGSLDITFSLSSTAGTVGNRYIFACESALQVLQNTNGIIYVLLPNNVLSVVVNQPVLNRIYRIRVNWDSGEAYIKLNENESKGVKYTGEVSSSYVRLGYRGNYAGSLGFNGTIFKCELKDGDGNILYSGTGLNEPESIGVTALTASDFMLQNGQGDNIERVYTDLLANGNNINTYKYALGLSFFRISSTATGTFPSGLVSYSGCTLLTSMWSDYAGAQILFVNSSTLYGAYYRQKINNNWTEWANLSNSLLLNSGAFTGDIDSGISLRKGMRSFPLTDATKGTFPTGITNANACMLNHYDWDANAANQVLFSYSPASARGIYWRQKASNVWGGWINISSNSNSGYPVKYTDLKSNSQDVVRALYTALVANPKLRVILHFEGGNEVGLMTAGECFVPVNVSLFVSVSDPYLYLENQKFLLDNQNNVYASARVEIKPGSSFTTTINVARIPEVSGINPLYLYEPGYSRGTQVTEFGGYYENATHFISSLLDAINNGNPILLVKAQADEPAYGKSVHRMLARTEGNNGSSSIYITVYDAYPDSTGKEYTLNVSLASNIVEIV